MFYCFFFYLCFVLFFGWFSFVVLRIKPRAGRYFSLDILSGSVDPAFVLSSLSGLMRRKQLSVFKRRGPRHLITQSGFEGILPILAIFLYHFQLHRELSCVVYQIGFLFFLLALLLVYGELFFGDFFFKPSDTCLSLHTRSPLSLLGILVVLLEHRRKQGIHKTPFSLEFCNKVNILNQLSSSRLPPFRSFIRQFRNGYIF